MLYLQYRRPKNMTGLLLANYKKNCVMKYFMLVFLLICWNSVALAQKVFKKGANHSYKGYVSTSLYGKEDPSGYMKSFEIGIQWTTYMGEPVENYSFKWEANSHFKVTIDGKLVTISKFGLSKYPDLVKKLEEVKPAHVDVVLYGQAKGGSVNVKPGRLPTESKLYEQNGGSVKKSGQSYRVYNLLATFLYVVRDANFLFARSGKRVSGSIVGGSPSWNNFIQWRDKNTYVGGGSMVSGTDVLNYPQEEYKQMSSDEKIRADLRFKNIYKAVNHLKISADIKKISWGYQLEAIAREYLMKEKKIEKKKDEKQEKKIANDDDWWNGNNEEPEKRKTALNTSDADWWNGADSEEKKPKNKNISDADFWNGKNETPDADKQKQSAYRIVNNYSKYGGNNEGKYSWVEDANGHIIIPKGKYYISSFIDGLAQIEILIRTDYFDFVRDRKVRLFEKCFVDKNGNKLPPKTYSMYYRGYYNPFTLYSASMSRAQIEESKRRNKAKDKNVYRQLKSIYSAKGFDID